MYNPYNCYPQYNRYSQYAQGLNGRIVSSYEEAKASQVTLDGTLNYFPCPAEGKIYVKSIDLNGMAIFQVYEMCKPTQATPTLEERVAELEKQWKGVFDDEPDVTNASDKKQ